MITPTPLLLWQGFPYPRSFKSSFFDTLPATNSGGKNEGRRLERVLTFSLQPQYLSYLCLGISGDDALPG